MKIDSHSLEPIDCFFAALRLAAVAGGTMWGIFAPLDDYARSSFFACLAVSAVFSLLLLESVRRDVVDTGFTYRVALVTDIVLIYWAVRVTGGGHSVLILGFYLFVALHAFHAGLRVGIAAATAASVLLLTLPGKGIWWGDFVLRLGFLHTLALCAGLLSHQEKRLAQDLLESRRAVEQAEKMAVLGTLGSGIAHEINNPASSIIVRIERMLLERQERGVAPETVEDLKIIQKHALRIGTILKRLLAFARPGGLDFERLDLNQIITEVVSLIEPRLREKRVSLSLSLTEDIPAVLGDRMRLEEVILNVLNNALDASHWGAVIDVTTKARDGTLEACITDRGAGIDPKDLGRVFDPFFTTKPTGQGTGLGLYVAYQIVKDHGGVISLSSSIGKRTTVTIRLPLLLESATTAEGSLRA